MSKDKMSEIDEHIAKRFDIHKRLGKGAYGIVWKAVDRKSKEIVAVKKIFDAFRNQTDAQRTFREIMFLQSFRNHPNIIQLHSIHRAANNRDIYLGFEYMETDLHNVIKRGNVLKDVHKRYIMYQLLKATKYIHSGNVIHRDQKPSNILLDTLCRCKIADFGLARTVSQCGDGSPNETDPTLTDYVATRWYRAPEILIANRHYTKGIDMWSLGCILGEMIAGKPIFPGSSTVNQIELIMATIPNPTIEDINAVCVSGVGSSMIKNACLAQKVAFKAILGPEIPMDAADLINSLLVFNPNRRLTAEQAIKHPYVAKFRDPHLEIEMPQQVAIPFSDDVRLSVDDYRNKLYEIMSTHGRGQKLKPVKPHKAIVKLESSFGLKNPPKQFCQQQLRHPNREITNNIESTKSSFSSKSRISHITRSEPKLNHLVRPQIVTHTRSDPKIPPKHYSNPHATTNINGSFNRSTKYEYKKCHNNCTTNSFGANNDMQNLNGKPARRRLDSRSNIYMSFNSYNPSHGIITQSALMELRSSGLR